MSTLKADTLVAADGTSPTTLTKQQASKCWAQWDMSGTAHIDSSFAISSLTDIDTGVGKITFTTAFDSAEYGFSTGIGEKTGGGNRGIGARGSSSGISASFMTFYSFAFPGSGGTSSNDVDLCCANWHGDLA